MMPLKTKKTIGIVLAISASIAWVTVHFARKIYAENVHAEGYLYLPSGSTFENLLEEVRPFLKNTEDFAWVATQKKYTKQLKGGRYLLQKGMNSNELVNLLRSGKQAAVQVTFNNQHRLELLAGRISKQIEADSISLMRAFTDSLFLANHGFSKKNAIGMYVPNTYEFLWNTSADGFRNKMYREYHKFWNVRRIAKAKTQNLEVQEVIALASIVQKETAQVSERPIVAGLYLNRYHKKWALQADPTVIFALQEKYGTNFEVKRVLNKDLKIDSPYNTYKYTGIPPGPIAMPDISSIDAVLNPSKHRYMFMCASTKTIGSHVFTKSLRQHNRNAKQYQRWLSSQGVHR